MRDGYTLTDLYDMASGYKGDYSRGRSMAIETRQAWAIEELERIKGKEVVEAWLKATLKKDKAAREQQEQVALEQQEPQAEKTQAREAEYAARIEYNRQIIQMNRRDNHRRRHKHD